MKRIKERFQEYKIEKSDIFFFLCLLSLIIDFTYLRIGIDITGVSMFWSLCAVLADSTLGVVPFLFIKGKKRFFIFILLVVVALLVVSNVVYFRNFSDMIGGVTYLSNIADIRVTEGALTSFRIIDILPLIGMVIPIASLWVFTPRVIVEESLSSGFRKVIIYICVICWIVSLVGSTRRYAIYRNKSTFKDAICEMIHFDGTWRDRYNAFNFAGYAVECMWRIASKSRSPLSEEESEEVKEYISDKNRKHKAGEVDSKKKNLIIIVVESLQSNILQLKNSDKITPTLDSLINSQSTLFVSDCHHLAGAGRSSDAQFVINTGLLPLRDEALVSNYGEGDYPSLAKAFPGDTKEIIGENEQCWFHYLTTKSYGYDTIVSNIADRCTDQDSVIFNRALIEIQKMSQPFYLFISTLSMHDPFLEPKVSDRSVDKYLSGITDNRDKEYLRRVNFFDRQFGIFIEQLKRIGLYEATLIVVVGDHEVNRNTISKELWADSVPLFILDEGELEYRKNEVSQMDIFPTILSIMGIDYEYGRFGVNYSGLGTSLYDLSSSGIPTEKDYYISAKIIKGK